MIAAARTAEATATPAPVLLLPQGTPPQLIRHGAVAFEAPREAAIAHETSRAIVGTHEGLTIRRVTICSRSEPILGRVWGECCTALLCLALHLVPHIKREPNGTLGMIGTRDRTRSLRLSARMAFRRSLRVRGNKACRQWITRLQITRQVNYPPAA
jgi:hypothetical protein